MEARAQHLAVHRHVGATALAASAKAGLGIFGDIHGIEVRTHANTEGELDLTGAARRIRFSSARHMIFTSRRPDGFWVSHFCLSHRC